MKKRLEDENKSLNIANELMIQEDYESAIKELEKILYHKVQVQEKFELLNKVTLIVWLLFLDNIENSVKRRVRRIDEALGRKTSKGKRRGSS